MYNLVFNDGTGTKISVPLTICRMSNQMYMPSGSPYIELYDGKLRKKVSQPQFRLMVELEYPALYDSNLVNTLDTIIEMSYDPAQSLFIAFADNNIIFSNNENFLAGDIEMILHEEPDVFWEYDRLSRKTGRVVTLASTTVHNKPFKFNTP